MSLKSKFHIPSLEEIDQTEKSKSAKIQPPRLFSSKPIGSHDTETKSKSLSADISKEKLTNVSQSSSSSNATGVQQDSTDISKINVVSKDTTQCSTYQESDNSITMRTSTLKSSVTSPEKQAENSTVAPVASKLPEAIQNSPGKEVPPQKPGKGNTLLVSPRQRGNPVLKYVRSVPWEFTDIVPDYQMGQTSCALFLSLRYHNLNPNYVHERLKQLGHSFDLRVLLVQVDVKDPHHSLRDLAKICLLADCTLMVAFSTEEAGGYLETYKAFENKPPEMIMEKLEANFMGKMTDALTTIRQVNKTDVQTLMTTFQSLEGIVKATEEDLSLCPGFGPQKASRLRNILRQPFLKVKKSKT